MNAEDVQARELATKIIDLLDNLRERQKVVEKRVIYIGMNEKRELMKLYPGLVEYNINGRFFMGIPVYVVDAQNHLAVY
jgi:hypothetical protein